MARGKATQQPRCQWPQIMHLEDQLGASGAGDSRRGPDIVGIGRRRDDCIGSGGGEFTRHAADLGGELQHVEQPLGAVAGIGAGT
ncbi:hypothetical protein D3C72_1794750 [compost metagenome]